jgi:hypothetical protein
MINRSPAISGLLLCAVLLSLSVYRAAARPAGSVKYNIVRTEKPHAKGSGLVIPYGFPSDSMGTTIGIAGIRRGYFQDQMGVGMTVFGSADEAQGTVFSSWDYRMPGLDRMYLSMLGSIAYYPRLRAYANYPGDFTGTKAGSNDSSPEDYVEDSGNNNWINLKMEYVLPIGKAHDDPVMRYRLKDGMLISGASGGSTWNPLECGVTVLMLQQRATYQCYETDIGKIDGRVKPMDLALLYNNTDFSPNPSRGGSQYLSITHDFFGDKEHGNWTFLEFEASKYFSLPVAAHALQQVIALNFWTGVSPDWEKYTDGDGVSVIKHKTPFFEGASLGGFYRMRGYPNHRFNDKAVIYTTAEYRHTLKWNPLRNMSWLNFMEPDWLQLVASVEGGQVAEEYGFSELFDDWKVCGGIGIRAMMSGVVFRFDISRSDEASNAWVMMGHPF